MQTSERIVNPRGSIVKAIRRIGESRSFFIGKAFGVNVL